MTCNKDCQHCMYAARAEPLIARCELPSRDRPTCNGSCQYCQHFKVYQWKIICTAHKGELYNGYIRVGSQ